MQKIISIKKLVQGGGPNPNLNPNLENIHTRARAHTHTYTHERAHYRAALDELSLSVPGSSSQQELFCFVRYMNATKLQNLKVLTAHVKKLLETTSHTPRCLLQRSERHLNMLKAQPDLTTRLFSVRKQCSVNH